MAIHRMGFLLPLLVVIAVTTSSAAQLGRNGFPDGFIFGCASSSYQYEGGAAEGGKGPSIWDTFTHKHPEKIADRSNGDVAIDSHHRYKEDVNLLKDMNMDAYRFSIAWPRILPNGSLSGGINREGVNYYNNLINYLLSKGMQPFVTLFHWDTPQTLDDAYGSFLSEKIIVDFRDYAEVCFREFGDRVKHWITFNEPLTYCRFGYGTGAMAPGRCSPWVGNCSGGDSGREPYVAGHNMLLSHAATVRLYNEKYKAFQKGSIGITLVSNWYVPLSKSNANRAAVARALDFMYGWFMDPLTYGDYPVTMRSLVGNRLLKFTKEQSEMVRGSFDFLGLNYYTTYYVSSSLPLSNQINTSYGTDSGTNSTGIRNGKPIGRRAASSWLFVYPPGIRKLLLYTKTKYKNPVVYITENGVDEANNNTLSLEEALKDDPRIDYISKHVLYMRRAIREGADVRGYFAWSLLDNFEWFNGYTVRFGLNYVDYNNGLNRYPKKSALWLSKILKK